MSKVLIISDTQAPFQHPKTIEFYKMLKKEFHPDEIVHIGDEFDWKFLKFMSINDPLSAKQQHEKATEFLRELADLFPNVKVCNSNHGDRLVNAASNANIPEWCLKTKNQLMGAPEGWGWKDSWVIDNVKYEHGNRFGGQKPHWTAVDRNHRSTVMGHHPGFGIQHFVRDNKEVFGMLVGSTTVDANHKRMGFGMKYAKKYSTGSCRGTGVVNHQQPQTILMSSVV